MIKAEEIIKEYGLINEEPEVKKVFLDILTKYLHGELRADLFAQISRILISNIETNGISITNVKLINAIETASDIDYFREKNIDLSRREDELKALYRDTLEDFQDEKGAKGLKKVKRGSGIPMIKIEKKFK